MSVAELKTTAATKQSDSKNCLWGREHQGRNQPTSNWIPGLFCSRRHMSDTVTLKRPWPQSLQALAENPYYGFPRWTYHQTAN